MSFLAELDDALLEDKQGAIKYADYRHSSERSFRFDDTVAACGNCKFFDTETEHCPDEEIGHCEVWVFCCKDEYVCNSHHEIVKSSSK